MHKEIYNICTDKYPLWANRLKALRYSIQYTVYSIQYTVYSTGPLLRICNWVGHLSQGTKNNVKRGPEKNLLKSIKLRLLA